MKIRAKRAFVLGRWSACESDMIDVPAKKPANAKAGGKRGKKAG